VNFFDNFLPLALVAVAIRVSVEDAEDFGTANTAMEQPWFLHAE
jgi:hypothetical protein